MSVSLDKQKMQNTVPTEQYDVIVVGAGPYGLSVAAHLLAQRLKVAVFGKPIYYWREHMPKGMLLRSYWWASDLSDPHGKYTMAQYFQAKGQQPVIPLPIETFIDYGLWFQQQAVPALDETYVESIEQSNGRFLVTLADRRVMQARIVVMAPGLQYYRYCPPEYAHLPAELVSHSADYSDLGGFAGKEVAVIGGGQSALESAALLHEHDTAVHVLARHGVRWVRFTNDHLPPLLRELRAPKAGMGSGWLNLLLEKYPYILQRFPHDTRDYVLTTRHGPAGAHWLKDRIVGNMPVREYCKIEKIEEAHGRVRLTQTTGEVLEVDHVLLATGYQADIAKLPMLHPALRDSIQTYLKSPDLSNSFESSVPGLYFVGFSAARSFGPFYRFVVGAKAASRRVTRAIVRQVARSRS